MATGKAREPGESVAQFVERIRSTYGDVLKVDSNARVVLAAFEDGGAYREYPGSHYMQNAEAMIAAYATHGLRVVQVQAIDAQPATPKADQPWRPFADIDEAFSTGSNFSARGGIKYNSKTNRWSRQDAIDPLSIGRITERAAKTLLAEARRVVGESPAAKGVTRIIDSFQRSKCLDAHLLMTISNVLPRKSVRDDSRLGLAYQMIMHLAALRKAEEAGDRKAAYHAIYAIGRYAEREFWKEKVEKLAMKQVKLGVDQKAGGDTTGRQSKERAADLNRNIAAWIKANVPSHATLTDKKLEDAVQKALRKLSNDDQTALGWTDRFNRSRVSTLREESRFLPKRNAT